MGSTARFYIGDDWVIPLTLSDPGGNPLNLAQLAVSATYYAPAGLTPASADVTAGITVTTAATGAVTCVIPRATTSLITGLPAGRKAPLAHLQVFTIDTVTSLKITRAVVAIEPLSASTYDPRRDSADGPNYQPPSIFPFDGCW